LFFGFTFCLEEKPLFLGARDGSGDVEPPPVGPNLLVRNHAPFGINLNWWSDVVFHESIWVFT